MFPFNSSNHLPFPDAQSDSGISARFLGLSGTLLEHVTSLFSLAALETGQLMKQTLACLLLFIATVLALFIAYLALLATGVALAVIQFNLSWTTTFGAVTLLHFLLAGILIVLLRQRRSHAPLAMTRAEIQRDIESLTANNSPFPSQEFYS